MLFSLPNAISEHMSYKSCSDCLSTLSEVQAIDYYFACNAIGQRAKLHAQQGIANDEQDTLFSEKQSVSSLFHTLLALSYFMRQGHSCLNINAISGKTLWADTEAGTTVVGFAFAQSTELSQVIQRFCNIAAARKDIHWSAPNLYTARYAHYEDTVAQFFVEQQKHRLEDASLQGQQQKQLTQCANALWSSLFPASTTESGKQAIDWQQVSVVNGLIAQTSIISGGAGTGKTYTVARLLIAWLYCQQKNAVGRCRLLLAAPTGKAAQRLNESILGEFSRLTKANPNTDVVKLIHGLMPMIQAKTMHRLLGLGMQGIEPRFNQSKTLECDFLVVDEASMIDLAMMAKLLRALPKTAKVVFIGDANQLPSVENGGLLKDLVNQSDWQNASRAHDFSLIYTDSHRSLLSALVPSFGTNNGLNDAPNLNDNAVVDYNYNHVTFLQKSMRSNTSIMQLAERILSGKPSDLLSFLNEYEITSETSTLASHASEQQLLFSQAEKNIQWHQDAYAPGGILKQDVIEKIAHGYAAVFASDNVNDAMLALQQYRLLSGTKKGRLGTEFLNMQIEQQLRKRFSHIEQGGVYRGMPIMIAQNDYRLKLFNGDIGIIWSNAQNQLLAFFQDTELSEGYRSYRVTSLPSFELVYAMTIHKTQGSEFDHVDIVLPNTKGNSSGQESVLHSAHHLNRELLYTGVTRAKKSIGLFANQAVLSDCLVNTSSRFSGLRVKLSTNIKAEY